MNRQVSGARGDAIVNLSVSTAHCGVNFVPLLNLLPIWPGCTNVRMRGDIVRLKHKRPATLATSTPSQALQSRPAGSESASR